MESKAYFCTHKRGYIVTTPSLVSTFSFQCLIFMLRHIAFPLTRACCLLCLAIGVAFAANAQPNSEANAERMSLEQCVRFALDNNIQAKQANLQVRGTGLTLWGARAAQYPNANGQVSQSVNLGRSVDPTTNSFAQATIWSNNWQLTGGATLYAGGTLRNSIKQAGVDVAAAQADEANTKNNIALSVSQAYLQVLLAEENLKVTRERLAQTRRQLAQVQKFIDAGSVPASNRLDTEAQEARDEQSIVAAQNNIDLSYLNLKVAMSYDLAKDIAIEHPDIKVTAGDDTYFAQQIYAASVKTYPAVAAAELRQKSAAIAVDIARGKLYPTLSTFASLSTNYSSASQRIAGYEPSITHLGTVNVGGTLYPLDLNTQRAITERNPYTNQLSDNFSQAVGVRLSVPIYNNSQTHIGIERASINAQNADLTADNTRRQLNADVQRAVADVRNAGRTLRAAEKTFTAQKAAFGNTEKRFNVGAGNSFELSVARSNLDTAEQNVIVARYDYLFKQKVLDFYQGIPIKF